MNFQLISLIIVFFVFDAIPGQAQDEVKATPEAAPLSVQKNVDDGIKSSPKIVVITGARFTYPLVQRWIDDYNLVNPEVQIIIESRGSSDPAQYDILAEVYAHDAETKTRRNYVTVGRYAILPVANSRSAFNEKYAHKGLTRELIQQIFFHDLYREEEEDKEIEARYTVYTRLQRAGAPIVFTKYFGFEQKDIKGKAIAGSDEHLLKALLRDSTGVSYLPLSLIYDQALKKPHEGISVLPVDLNDNGRISDDEKFYGDLPAVIKRLEAESPKKIHNIPIEDVHFSFDELTVDREAIDFIQWVIHEGIKDLHEFGYLQPDPTRLEKEKEAIASKRSDR